MEKRAVILAAAFALCLGPSLCSAQEQAGRAAVRKKALEEINTQLDEKRRELEAYKKDEDRLSAELGDLKKQDKKDSSYQRELEDRLSAARAKSSQSQQKYGLLEKYRKNLALDSRGMMGSYALLRDFYYPFYGNTEISKGILLKSAIIKKHALMGRLRGESIKINMDMQALERRGQELKLSKALLEKQRSAQKSEVKRKTGELDRARLQQAQLSRELEELQHAAQGLSRLVKKLEKQSPYRRETESRDLPLARHSLPWPAAGKVVSRFGREEVPALKTWIVREGVRIRTAREAQVFPVLPGKVIYAGPFRTYGNVVIIDHEKGFFTIYGLLSSMLAAKGDLISTAAPLGLSGSDTQEVGAKSGGGVGTVYFEIRKGEQALDPMLWLQN